MESSRKKSVPDRFEGLLVPVLIGLIVIAIYWQSLHTELWNDEIYSFLHFQRVPILRTLTDYHETNNHIFFNLVQNIYLRLIGWPAPLQVLQHPEIVRVVPLIYTIVTYLVLYHWMARMISPSSALLACALLTATLPYFNFALQYRAYSLVMMLGTIYGYQAWRYLRTGSSSRLIFVALCSALMFYAHPAGIYLVIALGLAVQVFYSPARNGKLPLSIRIAAATFGGGLLAGLAYLPVLHQLLANPWVAGHKIPVGQFLRDKLVSCSYQLFCGRYWLAILGIIGGIFWYLRSRKEKISSADQMWQWILFSILVYLIMFFIPLLRHDDAPQRTFTMLIPFLVSGMTIALTGFARIPAKGRMQNTVAILLSALLMIEAPFMIISRNKRADELNNLNVENASLLNGYYLHHFHPMRVAEMAKRVAGRDSLSVYYGTVYLQEMPHYMGALKVPLKEYRTPAQRSSAPDSFYLITSFPRKFMEFHAGEISCREVSDSLSFYSLLFVRKLRQLGPGLLQGSLRNQNTP